MKGTNESIFPKTFTQCVQGRIRSLSLDSGVGLILHNFRHLHCLFVHFLLDRRLPRHLWNSKMWSTSSALNVYLKMRWVVFLAAGGEGNWQSKFRQAHTISHPGTREQTQLEMAEGHFWNPLPLSPALGLEKLCRSGDKERPVSLTMSLHDLWEAAVRTSASTRCPLLLRALQRAPWGGGDWSHALLSSWGALCLHPGSAVISDTVQAISPSFRSCLFCCQKNQKAKLGDSSCEKDTQSSRSQLKQATPQVRTFQW